LKYESLVHVVIYHSRDITDVKVFKKYVKHQGKEIKLCMPIEKSCLKEHTQEILKPYHLPLKFLQTDRQGLSGQKLYAPNLLIQRALKMCSTVDNKLIY
jgi:hypothetical protein